MLVYSDERPGLVKAICKIIYSYITIFCGSAKNQNKIIYQKSAILEKQVDILI